LIYRNQVAIESSAIGLHYDANTKPFSTTSLPIPTTHATEDFAPEKAPLERAGLAGMAPGTDSAACRLAAVAGCGLGQ
jgi:hypothetical protein